MLSWRWTCLQLLCALRFIWEVKGSNSHGAFLCWLLEADFKVFMCSVCPALGRWSALLVFYKWSWPKLLVSLGGLSPCGSCYCWKSLCAWKERGSGVQTRVLSSLAVVNSNHLFSSPPCCLCPSVLFLFSCPVYIPPPPFLLILWPGFSLSPLLAWVPCC